MFKHFYSIEVASDIVRDRVKEVVNAVTATTITQMNSPQTGRNAPNVTGSVMQLRLSNAGSTMNSEQAVRASAPGYLQLCLERANEIIHKGMGAAELYAYVVLAGGVNSKLPLARASTHGLKSVVERTRMGRQRAADAIANLQQHGFLEPVKGAGKVGRTEARWQVDKDATCNLAVSQRFLAPMEKGLVRSKAAARLGDLFLHAAVTHEISVEQARIDALLLFLHLHAHQDFGQYGGVDPACVAVHFEPVNDAHACIQHTVDATRPGWTLITEQAAPHLPGLSDTLLSAALPSAPTSKEPPTPRVRGEHALEILRDLGLVYGAYVLWDSDPTIEPSSHRPSPLFTLYVKGSWAPDFEPFLQYRVNDVVLATGTRKGADAYRASLGASADWEGTGRHMYLLPNGFVGRATLIKQVRARWWALCEDTTAGLAQDQIRVEQWTERLAEFRSQGLRPKENVL